jgi:hypothetical protein
MTSNINPNNIDGAYPVAGQDNNSQGFRDNFTNTATNFQYAAEEITDLQNNAVLKSALAGTTLNNNMQGSVLSNAKLQDMSETVFSLGGVSGTTTIDYASGSFQTLTTNGAVSLAFTNFPPAPPTGGFASVTVQVTVANIIHTLILPAAVSVNRGIQGLNISNNTISFATTGVYSFTFTTFDAGTIITVSEVNTQLQPFNNSSQNLTDTAASNLALTTSYFSTVTATTATLAAGVAGQIKTFAMFAESGDMVITVSNAGWKTSGAGTMTFNAIGQACTLQYINGKWFCIGNNGVAFA